MILAWFFAAETGRGKNFRRVGKQEGIEGATDALHGVEVRLSKHFGHHFLFVFANAVLAGNGASGSNAQLENLKRESFSGFFLAGDTAVVENERVKIPVAGVEDVGDAQASFSAEAGNFAHDLRERGAGNDAVLNDVIGRDPAHGGESSFAAFPDESALRIRLRDANFPGAV